MKNRKAQGALEFLMTYGWAFLVILIMIGALAYFGVLNPTKFLPDRCQFASPPLLCKSDAYVINSSDTNTIRAVIINNYGVNVNVSNFNFTTDYSGVNCNAVTLGGVSVYGANSIVWTDGESKDLIANCVGGTGLSKGSKVKFNAKFSWFPTTTTAVYQKQTTGEIYASVQ